MQLCEKNCLGYKSGTDHWIFIKLKDMIYVNARLKMAQGQGHKDKGQGRICNYVKIVLPFK